MPTRWPPGVVAAVLFGLLTLVVGALGQGLNLNTDDSLLGASDRVKAVDELYRQQSSHRRQLDGAKAIVQRWKAPSPCGKAKPGAARLCGVDTAAAADRAAWLLAASPGSYDTRRAEHTGGFIAAPMPADQGDCNACVAHAVAAAAQGAMAAALRRNVSEVPRPSALQLFFCSGAPGQLQATDCGKGWKLQDGLAALTASRPKEQRSSEACMPFNTIERPFDILCRPRPGCAARVPQGTFDYTKMNPLREIWQIQQHIRDHGASVVTRMTVPAGFREFFAGNRRRSVYDAAAAAAAATGANGTKQALGPSFEHAVVLAGYNNSGNGTWLVWSSWGAEWADGGFARVRMGDLRLADPDNTFGVMFRPDGGAPEPPPLPLRSADANGTRGCFWYRAEPGDYVARVASKLGMSIEALLSLNSDSGLRRAGALLDPGTELLACEVNIAAACEKYNNCYACHASPGCTWCYEGQPESGYDRPDKREKPNCFASTESCGRAVLSIAECPTDGLPVLAAAAATAAAVGRPAAAPAASCASQPNCRSCLRFTYQCKWSVSGGNGTSACMGANGPSAAWYGWSPAECPRDGDPGAIWSRGSCADLGDCASCLQYGGVKPQCTWCESSNQCISGVDAKARASCPKLVTLGSSHCPKPPATKGD